MTNRQLGLLCRLPRKKRPLTGETVKRVLSGDNAAFDTVWVIADALKIKREALVDFKLKERDFYRAVTNGKRG